MGHAPLHTLGVIGVPTSAGALAPGREQAPPAPRDAGLVAQAVSAAFPGREP